MEEQPLFVNKPIDVADLPQLVDENYLSLHQEYLYLRLVASIILLAILSAVGVIIYFNTEFEIWQIYAPLLLIATFYVFVTVKGFRYKGYLLREHDISYRTGYIFRSTTTVPLVRIQHSEVTQGPLQRLFDLATVKIYTAGGQQSDLSVPGLLPAEAFKLRDFINNTVMGQ